MIRRSLAVAALAVGILCQAATARAERVAVECVVGEAPPDPDNLIAPVMEVLAQRGYVTDGELLAAMVPAGRRPQAAELPSAQVAELRGEIEAARQLFRRAATFRDDKRKKYEEAAVSLDAVWSRVKLSPAVLTSEDLGRDLQAALVTLAMAHDRAGNRAASRDAIAEYQHAFFGTEIDYDRFGPEPHEMARELTKVWRKRGFGTLAVTTDDPRGAIFISAYLAGTGSVELELPPGNYQVFVKSGQQFGHIHEVKIRSKKRTELAVRTRFERALQVGDSRVALAVGAGGDSAWLAALGTELGALMAVEDQVVLVGFREYEDRAAVFGAVVKPGGRLIEREAAIYYRDPGEISVRTLRDLGAYLAGEAPAPGLEVMGGAVAAPIAGESRPAPPVKLSAPRRDGPRRRSRIPAVTAWTVGAGAIGAGVYLLLLDGEGSCDTSGEICPRRYDTAMSGYASIGAGVAMGALGTWLWLRARPKSKARLAITPGRDQLGVMVWTEF